ncbi:MAG: YkgJ family cysteine cluster protein [Nitrospirae bacterium]|nr:YkgJ family cysteine cluster protein [Nitrospirota bacterium]
MSAPSAGHARLLAHSEAWFNRARAALLGELPCRQGCCRCCVGPFAITILDAAELQRGLATLDGSVRQDIEATAHRQTAAIEAEFPRLSESPFLDGWSDPEQDAVVERFADLPCPALGSDGSCHVYPFRPVTCRTTGIPVETDGLVEGACQVQTAVPLIRLPRSLRDEESRLAELEADEIDARRRTAPPAGEEVLLAYGFLAERVPIF